MEEKLRSVEAHRARMEELMVKYRLKPENIEFVDEFPGDPHRISRCSKIEAKVIFKRLVSEEDIDVNIELLSGQFEDKLRLFKDEWSFFKQRLLKEICHILNRYKDEYECNKWAFYEMTK